MRPREPDAPSVAGESDSSLDSRRSKVSVGDVMSVHMTSPTNTVERRELSRTHWRQWWLNPKIVHHSA